MRPHVICILQLLQLEHTECGEAVQGTHALFTRNRYSIFRGPCMLADPPELHPGRVEVKLKDSYALHAARCDPVGISPCPGGPRHRSATRGPIMLHIWAVSAIVAT
jgi:hypothetical protein